MVAGRLLSAGSTVLKQTGAGCQGQIARLDIGTVCALLKPERRDRRVVPPGHRLLAFCAIRAVAVASRNAIKCDGIHRATMWASEVIAGAALPSPYHVPSTMSWHPPRARSVCRRVWPGRLARAPPESPMSPVIAAPRAAGVLRSTGPAAPATATRGSSALDKPTEPCGCHGATGPFWAIQPDEKAPGVISQIGV
jgi:hypothetical protein